jgi:hypothetical protein
MDPSRNCNKVIGRSAFMSFGDGMVPSPKFGVTFVTSESVGEYAPFGSAGDWIVESSAVTSLNHVVPPNAEP